MVNILWKKSTVLSGTIGSKKSDEMCNQKHIEQMQVWTVCDWVQKKKLNMNETVLQILTCLGNEKNNAFGIRRFFAKKSITKISHPPYLPDVSPYDFGLFIKLKKCLERTNIWWHLTARNYITERYSGKQVPRMFPSMASSFHEMHIFEGDSSHVKVSGSKVSKNSLLLWY